MRHRACPQCGDSFAAETGRANSADKIGAPLYCGRVCAGLARRLAMPKTPEQKKAEKAAYDKVRRERLGEVLRERKRSAYYANHREMLRRHAAYRVNRMPSHVEYCRRPEYKAKKHIYDLQRNSAEYGEFAEAHRLLVDLEKEIRSQATAYERRVANGYYTRSAQKRRRELWLTKTSTQAI